MIKHAFYNQLPGIWCEVNSRSEFTYVNRPYCELVGVKNDKYLLGKTVADLPCDASECAEIFWKEDKLVLNTQKEQKFLNVVKLAQNDWHVIQLTKKPIINAASQIEAILFNITLQDRSEMQNIAVKMAQSLEPHHQNSKQFSLSINNAILDKLSKKEHECLFFLVHGKTYKEISILQSVTQRTIVDHIERIKFKLNAQSKSELIGKALELGLNYQIPQSLFTNQLSILL